MGQPAARVGDKCIVHCSPPVIGAPGAPTVLIQGQPAARMGDQIVPHLMPGPEFCIPHPSSIAKGSATVLIQGQPAARLGDPLVACTAIAAPCAPTVLIGG